MNTTIIIRKAGLLKERRKSIVSEIQDRFIRNF